MDRRKLALAVTALLLSWPALVQAAPPAAKTTLVIKGMTCGGCVAAVKVQLRKTEGVTAYEVSLAKGEAVVTYDPGRSDPKKIAASVSKSGFEATVKSDKKAEAASTAPVDGMEIAALREWFSRSKG